MDKGSRKVHREKLLTDPTTFMEDMSTLIKNRKKEDVLGMLTLTEKYDKAAILHVITFIIFQMRLNTALMHMTD